METISYNQPADAIIEQQAQQLLAQVPQIGIEKAREIALRILPWLKCPQYQTRVEPMTCQLCPFGHMTECHFPKLCSEAKCNHYRQQIAMETDL